MRIGLFLTLLCLAFPLSAQEYIRLMEQPQANFYDIQAAFEAHWQGRRGGKGTGYKQFLRWADWMEPRVYPSGEFPPADLPAREMERFRSALPSHSRSGTATWNQYMYHDSLAYTPFSAIPGHGRISCVAFSPSDSSRLYIGTPSGGLWTSSNGGDSWTPLTDHLPVLGVADLVVHPDNDSILYLATGDNTFTHTFSIGIVKSTDRGATWNPAGLSFGVSQTQLVRKLLIHPEHPDTLWAASTIGILRSSNGGNSWNPVGSISARDLEFRPGDYQTLYATTNGGFYKSTDGGMSFQASGLPENSAVSRMELAVTPADSNRVYVIASAASDGSLYAVYRSEDAGSSFVQTAVNTNILGYWPTGGSGGQGWYDMDIAADPLDANTVFTAGINIWKSTDGGDSFAPTSDWSAPGTSDYVHGDVHKLEFDRGRLFTTCDGGLFRSDDLGANWRDLSSDLTIYQIYFMSQSPHDEQVVLAGMQDVGSSIYRDGHWTTVTWGDGFKSFFDPADSLKMYTTAHLGQFFRTAFGINGFYQYFPNINETSAFASVMAQDPSNPQTFYLGYQNVWKSTNATLSWTPISNLGNSFPLQRLEVAPNNPQALYATSNFLAYRTLNGGTNWTNITPGLPTNFAALSGLHVDPNNYLNLWVTFSGYTFGQKVYASTDGGITWLNISQNLPNLPANCIVNEGDSLHGLYIGMDVGVYYTNDTLNGWIPFMDGLPNVIVNDLDIVPSLHSIRAATFGRGVWESFLFSDPPVVARPSPQASSEHMLIYPNPSSEYVVLDYSQVKGFEPELVEVFALQGQLVKQMEWQIQAQPRHLLPIGDLAPGNYLVVLQGKNGRELKERFVRLER